MPDTFQIETRYVYIHPYRLWVNYNFYREKAMVKICFTSIPNEIFFFLFRFFLIVVNRVKRNWLSPYYCYWMVKYGVEKNVIQGVQNELIFSTNSLCQQKTPYVVHFFWFWTYVLLPTIAYKSHCVGVHKNTIDCIQHTKKLFIFLPAEYSNASFCNMHGM